MADTLKAVQTLDDDVNWIFDGIICLDDVERVGLNLFLRDLEESCRAKV